jgi:hypothetical protein
MKLEMGPRAMVVLHAIGTAGPQDGDDHSPRGGRPPRSARTLVQAHPRPAHSTKFLPAHVCLVFSFPAPGAVAPSVASAANSTSATMPGAVGAGSGGSSRPVAAAGSSSNAAGRSAADAGEGSNPVDGYDEGELTKPIKELSDKWKLLPAFLQVRLKSTQTGIRLHRATE